jgi:hypothetical protein
MALTVAIGCGSSEQIRSYPIAKEIESTPMAATAAVEVGEPTDRMLAAVLPAGERAWFFKVAGPAAAVEKQEAAIDEFFESISLTDAGQPRWDLPAGWKEEPGRGMRAATIRIPAEAAALELSVIGLPWRGTPGELLSNINRWRGQMKLPEVGRPQLADFTREKKIGDVKMTVVDLRGRFDAGPAMAAPFAGQAAGSAGQAAPPAGEPALPPGHPPIAEPRYVGKAAPPGAPKFEAPDAWQPLPAGGMRKAAFQIGGEKAGAVVTVIDFPADAGPMIADPLENVNRWRREVGMPELTKEQLGDTVETIEVGGQKSSYVRLIPDADKPAESQAARATLAALVHSGGRIWFFKLSGARDVVADQEDEFKSFLKSVEFAADAGAGDGNR